jgi:DNA polymerase-4
VVPDRPRKSSGSETTYERDLATPEEVEAGITALAAEVWEWCEGARQLGRSVTLKLRYADFRQVTRSRTLAAPIASGRDLTELTLGLLRGLYPLDRKVRLLGVTVSGFDAPGFGPPGLAASGLAAPAQASLDLG